MKTQLIEATAKRFKATTFVGSMMIATGAVTAWLIMQIDGTERGEVLGACVGMGIAAVGGLVWLVGAALAWWHHA